MEDLNDNAPKFRPSENINISISENNQAGDLIITLNATDADSSSADGQRGNGVVRYALGETFLSLNGERVAAGSPSDFFLVERDTGRLRAKVPFDRETHRSFGFLVIATDLAGLQNSSIMAVFEFTGST